MKIALLITSLLLISGLSYSETHTEKPIAHPNAKTSADKKPATQPAPSVDKGQPTPPQEASGERDKDRVIQREILTETTKLGSYTFWLAIATGVLGIAAMWQAIISRNSARRQLRAYISVDTEAIKDHEGKELNKLGLAISNKGQTPAHKLTHWTYVGVREFPLIKELDLPPEDRPRIISVLHPGERRIVASNYPNATAEERDAISKGTMAIYAWGEVSYEDAFEKPHITKFRFFHSGEGVRLGRWAHYKYGNEAD